MFILFICLASDVLAMDDFGPSNWDANILSVDLGYVNIKANNIADAWSEMSTKYLIRANLYIDAATVPSEAPFVFQKNATAKELVDAFLTSYPAFTYLQDSKSGVIWFYPKREHYNAILSQTIRITHQANQVPVYSGIYAPLCKLLAPNVVDSSDAELPGSILIDRSTGKPPIPQNWQYCVDLSIGVCSFRDLLNTCCAANPTKAFLVRSPTGQHGPLTIFLNDLVYLNPLVPPRVEAIKFWELKIGMATNRIPSTEEVRLAMCDSDPRKRCAASFYLEASTRHYSPLILIGKADGSDKTIWTAFGAEYALWRNADSSFFTEMMPNFPKLREDLRQIKNPDLALLASLQLTREKQDASFLDAIVTKHVYSEAEIASIKPEVDRMARSSKAVRDKLMEIKSQVPEFSSRVLDELADTNLFILVPEAKN